MKTIPGLPDLIPGSLFCIGRNYRKHAHELGNDVPVQPLVFLKPAASIIGDGDAIRLPPQSHDVHHEVELIIAIAEKMKNVPKEKVTDCIAGYGIGIDVTARDIQQQAKDRGHPWSVAKGFNTFAPISKFIPATPGTDFSSMKLSLEVNGQIRQKGYTYDMIFPVEEILAYLSTIFSLHPGDLIFTGTPEGVSAIESGDQIQASLNNEITLNISVNRDHD